MKTIIYENIYNKERYVTLGKRDKKVIDGVEFIKVLLEGTKREVLIRKDYLKKVNT